MIGLALLVASSQARMSLQYYQGSFYVRDGIWTFAAPLKNEVEPEDHIRFRRGETFAVWDKRGLSIRNGNWIYDTRFKELAVSPKLFSKTEIRSNLQREKKGDIVFDATAMSGALRLGTDAFFLPRWIDRRGRTWLEALVRIDLGAQHPKPMLLGKFNGTSLANGSIDHRLIAFEQKPTLIVRQGNEWGISTYDPLASEFYYAHVGERLRAYAVLESPNIAFIEAEDSGLTRVGVADLSNGNRTDVLEDRGAIRLLDPLRPLCALVTASERTTIRNLQTGSAFDLPPDSASVRTPAGVVVYWPKKAPKHAALLDPARWEGLANWNADQATPEP